MGKNAKGNCNSWNSEMAGKTKAGVKGESLTTEKIENAEKATKNGMLFHRI